MLLIQHGRLQVFVKLGRNALWDTFPNKPCTTSVRGKVYLVDFNANTVIHLLCKKNRCQNSYFSLPS